MLKEIKINIFYILDNVIDITRRCPIVNQDFRMFPGKKQQSIQGTTKSKKSKFKLRNYRHPKKLDLELQHGIRIPIPSDTANDKALYNSYLVRGRGGRGSCTYDLALSI